MLGGATRDARDALGEREHARSRVRIRLGDAIGDHHAVFDHRAVAQRREAFIRRVFVDSSTTPVTFWVGSNHGASIIKLEPLD